MFAIINKFAPKKPQARARLKGPDGKMADQYLAHSLTVAFVKEMWAGPDRLPIYSDRAPGIPFSLDALHRAIAGLNPHKSVAQPFLPAIIWKSAPAQVATELYRQLQTWWSYSPPMIPQSWKGLLDIFYPQTG